MEAATEFVVESPDVVYSPEAIEAHYEYRTTCVSREGGVLKVSEGPTGRAMGLGEPGSREGAGIAQRLRLPPCSEAGEACGPAAHRAARPQVHPTSTRFTFRTARQVPRLGVMLVGWGGNNGSTLTAAVLANRLRLSWPRRTCHKEANYSASLTQAAPLTWAWSTKARRYSCPSARCCPWWRPTTSYPTAGP